MHKRIDPKLLIISIIAGIGIAVITILFLVNPQKESVDEQSLRERESQISINFPESDISEESSVEMSSSVIKEQIASEVVSDLKPVSNHDRVSQNEHYVGTFNGFKRSTSNRTYHSSDEEQYQIDAEQNKETMKKALEAVFNYLGSYNNWNGIDWQGRTPRKVTAEDGIYDYFIQDGLLVNNFVSTLNRTRLSREGYFGQGGTKVHVTFPTLGDKYTMDYCTISDITIVPDGGTQVMKFEVRVGYSVENMLEPEDIVFTATFTNEGKIAEIDFNRHLTVPKPE